VKWIVVLVGVLLATVVLVGGIGMALPRDHVASRGLMLHQPPDVVWRTISDFQAGPSWRQDVTRVDRGPDRNGHAVWIEEGTNGRLPLEVVDERAPSRLVTRVGSAETSFGGTWTFEVTPDPAGTRLTITEAGWVSNPVFRVVSRFVMGHHATMDLYLRNLATKFHEPAVLSGQ
jgi:hypothetical protein